MNEASYKNLHILGFNVYEVSRVVKFTNTGRRLESDGCWREGTLERLLIGKKFLLGIKTMFFKLVVMMHNSVNILKTIVLHTFKE